MQLTTTNNFELGIMLYKLVFKFSDVRIFWTKKKYISKYQA